MQTDHATEEQMSAMLDRQLSEEEKPIVEAHVATCVQCQENLKQLQTTVAALQALPQARAPRSFRVPTVRREARESGLGALLSPFRRPVALRALAGLAAVLMVALFATDGLQPAMVVPTTEQRRDAAAPMPAAEQAHSGAGSETTSAGQEPGGTEALPQARIPARLAQPQPPPTAPEFAAPALPYSSDDAALSSAPPGTQPAESPTLREVPGSRGVEATLPDPGSTRQTDISPASWLTTGRMVAFALGALALALLIGSFRVRTR